MRRLLSVALLSGLALLAACEDTFTVPDLNNPGLESLATNPTRAAVIDATQGLLIGARLSIDNQSGYVNHLGTLGREALTFDNSDPRYFDEMLAGLLNPGNGAFGGSQWDPRYANIRNANIVLNSLDAVTGFSGAELEGIRGFAKTMQALDLFIVLNTRDGNGVVVDTDKAIDEDPGALVGKTAAQDAIMALLNAASGHLASAGTSFTFQLPGYTGFNTPATFEQFVSALRARMEVYRGNYGAALTELAGTFVNLGGDLTVGPQYVYGTGSGENQNGLFQGADPQIVAHPTMWTDAPLKADLTMDNRALAKLQLLTTPKSDPRGVTSNVRFTHYASVSSPISIIRNEELLLLEAEARWFTGDMPGAMTYLNDVRTRSGGLVALGMPATDNDFVDALLVERRYSLMLEGHRWLDMRRFGRLGTLPLDRPTDVVATDFPIPRDECIARDLPVPCDL